MYMKIGGKSWLRGNLVQTVIGIFSFLRSSLSLPAWVVEFSGFCTPYKYLMLRSLQQIRLGLRNPWLSFRPEGEIFTPSLDFGSTTRFHSTLEMTVRNISKYQVAR